MNDISREELYYMVNPVFATAKGCLGLLKNTGIKEAAELAEQIDTTVKGSANTPQEIRNIYMVSNEARYHIGNILAKESDCDVIVDLPCGYVPRGIVVADMKKAFYGLDLPAVIEELEPAIMKIATEEQKKYLHFKAVDATNYASLKDALSDAKGKLCILMDGLLGYFNEPELNTVCENMKKLLAEHGGCWITADRYSRIQAAETYQALTGGDGEFIKAMMSKGGAKVADIPVNHTVIQEGTPEECKAVFAGHGFAVQEISYADKMPELMSLKDAPEKTAKLKEAYQNIKVWIMTLRETPAEAAGEEKAFGCAFSADGSRLLCSITGRLDTITAPELLTGFHNSRTEGIEEITVDLAETEYISSAGLRVLLSMCKSLPDSRKFRIINCSDAVREILEVTGFDQIFQIG